MRTFASLEEMRNAPQEEYLAWRKRVVSRLSTLAVLGLIAVIAGAVLAVLGWVAASLPRELGGGVIFTAGGIAMGISVTFARLIDVRERELGIRTKWKPPLPPSPPLPTSPLEWEDPKSSWMEGTPMGRAKRGLVGFGLVFLALVLLTIVVGELLGDSSHAIRLATDSGVAVGGIYAMMVVMILGTARAAKRAVRVGPAGVSLRTGGVVIRWKWDQIWPENRPVRMGEFAFSWSGQSLGGRLLTDKLRLTREQARLVLSYPSGRTWDLSPQDRASLGLP